MEICACYPGASYKDTWEEWRDCSGSHRTCILILAFYLLLTDISDLSFSMGGGGGCGEGGGGKEGRLDGGIDMTFNIHFSFD